VTVSRQFKYPVFKTNELEGHIFYIDAFSFLALFLPDILTLFQQFTEKFGKEF
jgi:hypothetical protein